MAKRKVPKSIAGVKLRKPLRRELTVLLASDAGLAALQSMVRGADAALADKSLKPALAGAFAEAGRAFQAALDAQRTAIAEEAELTEPLGGPDMPRLEDLH